jgi:hypothetical protein
MGYDSTYGFDGSITVNQFDHDVVKDRSDQRNKIADRVNADQVIREEAFNTKLLYVTEEGKKQGFTLEQVVEAPTPNTVEYVLQSRQQTYGVFANNAGVAQAIKAAMHTDRFRSLSPDKQEALDQIASKISRIVTANASEYKDSWTDIQGYSKLIADTLPEDK